MNYLSCKSRIAVKAAKPDRFSSTALRLCGSTAAFTLMELVLVIAVLGVIAGLGIGNYANFLRQSSLDSAANEIIATLRKAQTNSQASSDGYAWGVEFDTTNKDRYTLFQGKCATTSSVSCRVGGAGEDCPGSESCNTTDKETIFLPSSVEISSASFNGKIYTVFDRPTGKPKASFDGNAVIQLKGGATKTITVSALGKIE